MQPVSTVVLRRLRNLCLSQQYQNSWKQIDDIGLTAPENGRQYYYFFAQ